MSKEKPENLLDVDIEPMETEDSKDEKLFKEQKKKYILKGIISVISCIINTCGHLSVFNLGHTMVYLLSFRRHYNQNLNFSHGYFLFPILSCTLAFTVGPTGIIEKKLGGKKTIFLSFLILCFSFILLYFSRTLLFDYIIMSFMGFGVAAGIKLGKKNACSYFMNRKSLISGIVFLVPNSVNAILSIFNEKYILNPLGESPTIEKTYYDEKIFLNYQKLIIFEIGFLIIACLLTLLTYIKNDPKETIKFGFGEKTNEGKGIGRPNKNKNDSNPMIKKALFSKRTMKLFLMSFLFYPTIRFINNTWRPIGIYYKIRTDYLQMVGALFSMTGSFSSLMFSFLGDRIKFKYLFCFLSFCLALTSFCFILSFHNGILFVLVIIINAFIFNGFNIIIDPFIMKVYGMENFVEISGFIRASSGIAEICSITLAFYLENYFTGSKDFVYKCMYYISGFSAFISFILGIFESDDKFNYNN